MIFEISCFVGTGISIYILHYLIKTDQRRWKSDFWPPSYLIAQWLSNSHWFTWSWSKYTSANIRPYFSKDTLRKVTILSKIKPCNLSRDMIAAIFSFGFCVFSSGLSIPLKRTEKREIIWTFYFHIPSFIE